MVVRQYLEVVDLSSMTRPSPPPILGELQSPESTASQIAALRGLKNEIIGHDQRKEAWISWGIVPILSKILASSRRASGKRVVPPELNGEKELRRSGGNRTEEDEACLQAIIVVGSLAQGNYQFCPFPTFIANLPFHHQSVKHLITAR